MKDKTREFGLTMRKGVEEYKEWQWGPFSITKFRTPQQGQLAFSFMLYPIGLTFFVWSNNG